MNAFYYIKHKGKIACLLLAIITLVLFSNKSYNDNIVKLGSAFDEVYADRLVAQDHIYRISKAVYLQKMQLLEDRHFQNKPETFVAANAAIGKIMDQYAKTKLTAAEKIVFSDLKKNMHALRYLSNRSHQPLTASAAFALRSVYEKQIDLSLQQLDLLSGIQVSRGKNLHTASRKIVSFSNIINQFDWAMLIIIGIVIQVIVFSSRSTQPQIKQHPFLN